MELLDSEADDNCKPRAGGIDEEEIDLTDLTSLVEDTVCWTIILILYNRYSLIPNYIFHILPRLQPGQDANIACRNPNNQKRIYTTLSIAMHSLLYYNLI
jgi:hypothetical protein